MKSDFTISTGTAEHCTFSDMAQDMALRSKKQKQKSNYEQVLSVDRKDVKWVSLERRRSCSRAADAPPWPASFSVWIKDRNQAAGHPVPSKLWASLKLKLTWVPDYFPCIWWWKKWQQKKTFNPTENKRRGTRVQGNDWEAQWNYTQNINNVYIHYDHETRLWV